MPRSAQVPGGEEEKLFTMKFKDYAREKLIEDYEDGLLFADNHGPFAGAANAGNRRLRVHQVAFPAGVARSIDF